MATHTGDEGVIKIGANTVAETRSWSIEESADTREDTRIGVTGRTYKAGKTNWQATLEAWWDETDTNGQEAMTIGTEVTLNLYPEGDASGDQYFSGSAIVTGRNVSADQEGMVEASLTLQGNGALTHPTVA